ncbi:lipopolysaccharide assembly protein LapA domain-containing protein [Celeribacter sp.]|uniref:lipopolysaccharide assembly protein LapA domain-containing protein n=1 Tax=Celeribacter sp. TaxID=1890673 RepID=UPI003A8F9563
MRYIRYAFLAVIAVVLITLALANRSMVTLNLLPSELAQLVGIGYAITVPLFSVIFAAVVAGLLIGFFWEWMRESKHRAEARNNRLAKERLAREVSKLKTAKAKDEGDEVLALLEG